MKYIRESTQEDIEKMDKEISVNLYNLYYSHFIGEASWSGLASSDGGWGRKYMTIINEAGENIGLVQMSRKIPRNVAYLAFVIYEKYSNNGYGTKAIYDVIKLCSSIGINNIILNTTSRRLVNYYENIGFEVVGCIKNRICLPDGSINNQYILQKII